MFHKLFSFIKRIIFSAFVLYGYNLVMAPLSLMVPINIITVLTLSILGFPALLGFIVLLLVLF